MVRRFHPAPLRASEAKPLGRIGIVLVVRQHSRGLSLLVKFGIGNIEPNPRCDVATIISSFACLSVIINFQGSFVLMLFTGKLDDLEPPFFVVVDATVWTETFVSEDVGRSF